MAKGKANTPHIGIYGRRNVGKSSLINMLTGQDTAIVSEQAGTTTDPVKKSYEITGFGPVILIDTAGIDDTGALGSQRVSKSLKSIDTIDLGILVICDETWGAFEKQLIDKFSFFDLPYILVFNKSDLGQPSTNFIEIVKKNTNKELVYISTLDSANIDKLVKLIKKNIPEQSLKIPTLFGDIIKQGDIVILITPIDVEAPEGRLILPQVQAIRDIINNDAIAIVLKEREVDTFLKQSKIVPALAITDSQIFTKADASIPPEIPLTSFSIALARLKADFDVYLRGTPKISELKDGDKVLLLESCTHHTSCDDIGRVKIPRWISNFTGKQLDYDIVTGLDKIEKPIKYYSLIIQCGACMITKKQLHNRIRLAINAGVPVSNYGMAIAYVQGIFERAIKPFTANNGTSHNYL